MTGFILENGLFPSSPISGSLRASDKLSLSTTEGLLTEPSGSISLMYVPQWYPEELSSGFDPCVLEANDEARNFVFRLSHDASARGRLRLEVCEGSERTRSWTSALDIPSSGPFTVSFDWTSKDALVFLDGILHIRADLVHSFARAKSMAWGHRANSDDHGLFAHMQKIVCYTTSIRDDDLRILLFHLDDEVYQRYQADFSVRLLEHKIFMEKAMERARPLVAKVFAWARDLHEFRTWGTEAHLRDDLYRKLKYDAFVAPREQYSPYGETDITVYLALQTHLGELPWPVRIEVKIWGRNDYKEVPTKPIKYMGEEEEVSLYLMIVPESTGERQKKLVEFAISNSVYPVTSPPAVCPFGKAFPFHFVSEHYVQAQSRTKLVIGVMCAASQQSQGRGF